MDAPIERPKTQFVPRRRFLSDRGVANFFLLPAIFLLIAMNVFPLFWSLYLSFCKYVGTSNKAPEWIGGANYSRLFMDPDFAPDIWKNFQVTAQFTLMAVVAQLLIGFGMAVLLNRTFRAKGIVTTLILLPMMLSPVVVGLFWKYMFHTDLGIVNWILTSVFHIPHVNWLNQPDTAMWSLVIVDTWMWSPFVMLISLAGLNAVPPHLYEAAEVDRASAWFKFRHITLPMVSPLVMIALLFRTMDCFKIFDTVYVLTGGAPGDATKTVSYSLYKQAFDAHNTGYACALAYVILLIIIGLANLYIKYLAKVRGESVPDAVPLLGNLTEKLQGVPVLGWFMETPGRLVGLLALIAFWRQIRDFLMFLGGHYVLLIGLVVLGAALFGISRLPQTARNLFAYVAIGLAAVAYLFPIYWIVVTSFKPSKQIFAIPPKFVFTHMAPHGEDAQPGFAAGLTLENYDAILFKREGNTWDGKIEGAGDFPHQFGNSLFIGGLSTFLAVALGTMAAYAFARFRIKGKGDLLFFILSTRMMPAMVAIIPIFLMYRTLGLLDTALGLIILYTVFNLSFSTYLLKGFFDDIPHEYDDAALLDGYSRIQTFLKISLPQALTGIAATAVFCFITAWNEFAFSQMLSIKQPITAPPAIVYRYGSGGVEWGQIAAGAVIFLIPAAIFTFAMRKHLLRGVTFGAIKK